MGELEDTRSFFANRIGVHSQQHLSFDHISPKLSQRFADQHFLEVRALANRVCAKVAYGEETVLHGPHLIRKSAR